MDEILINALKKYFSTLSNMGSVDKHLKRNLYLVSSVYSFYKAFYHFINKEDAEKLTQFFRCIMKDNCLYPKSIPCITYGGDYPTDSLITIIENDIIQTLNGATMVSQNRQTQDFKDFVILTDLQADNYVVGYDNSDNREVAINVQDLGVFWGVDI